MNKLSFAVSFLAVSLAAQDEAKTGHDVWYADFDKAVTAATEAKKDLLVDFTGSDWCGWCIRLHQEVFAHDSFLAGAQKNFVLVALDYPRGDEAKAKVPNPDRNKELAEKYAVRGFPTVLLMTPEGKVFGKTGYAPGGPESYLAALDEMRVKGKQRMADLAALSEAHAKAKPGKEQDAVVATAVRLLGEMTEEDVDVEKVAEIAKHAVDGEDEATMRAAVKALAKTGQADAAALAKARALDPKNEDGMLELAVYRQMNGVRDDAGAKEALAELDKLLALGVKDKELQTGLLFTAMRWSQQALGDTEGAKRYAEALQKHVAGTPEAEQLGPIIDKILGGK